MFSSIGLPEILIILVVALILFGGRKIPQLARDLGTGIREFKRSLSKNSLEIEDEIEGIEDTEQKPMARPSPTRVKMQTKKKASPKKQTRKKS